MDILTYINRMNQIYGNEPAPVRYNTQQYLQGGRVGYKPGGIVEPGVTHYATQTSAEKRATHYKKLLENLPEGYYNEYVENFYTVDKDTGKLRHVSGGPEGKGIPYMEKTYGDIIKKTYKTRQGETINLNRKVRNINAAIKQSISDKIESGLKPSRLVRKEDLKIVGHWQPTAPKGYVTHHFMPLAGVEGESLNLASTKNTAFISEELNSKMAPYDTKLKANQKEQIKLLKEKPKGWEKRIEELNFKAKNIYKEAAKKVPGSSGYLGYSQYIKQPEGSYVPKVTGIDSNKSLAGLKGKEIFFKNISPEDRLKVNEMSNIKSNKIISKAVPEPLLISGEQTLTPDGYRFTGIDYDKPSRVAQLLNQGILKTPKPVGSVLRGAGKLATGVGRFIFDPFLFPSIPVEMMISGAAGFEKNKKELKKALKDAPIVSQMAKEYNMTAEEVRNAIFEKYREAALANETGLEEQMAFVPAHQKDVEKFDKNFFPFWDTESYEGNPHADTSYVKKEPFKQMVGDSFLAARAEDEEAERKLRTGEIAGTQFYKKPTYYTKKDYYPDDFSDKTLAGQLRSAKQIRFENLRGLEDPLPAGFFKGGRVSFKFGSKGVDVGRRKFLQLLAALGIGTATVGTGLIKLGGKTIGKKVIAKTGVDIVSSTPGMPSWFPALVNKIIKEGDDVTSKLATQERQLVHTKKLPDGEQVTVHRDLDTGDIRVEYNSRHSMGEGYEPVHLEYKAGQVIDEGKMAGKKTDPEFSASEVEPQGHTQGPDDYSIDWDGNNIVGNVDDLISDTSKLKQFATNKKPTMKEIVTRKRKTDEVSAIHKNESDYIVKKQGEYLDYDDYLPDIDDID